ncbi:ABC transporter permease subunit [Mesorhizobium sp. M1C.F.Ca.ET.193.01.1.1]|nr:ABC transporter permease subunit [Mesorhizobium sp. M3A.F.Ca.ET.080.04.2.1]RWB11251.1 MAG: ABC transporter permease subunit [Mesorhizobium sp.]TGQ49828.1 ABC transporter permease subunit [Mesorhizobium sp. M1C.F.Ca.ET.210.01.1.1]TGQ62727.1 ABC transporter permease subunit [bacterium M00.F.Ca.ET.205.01.1.1]TGQ64294.1 ABC transporter permease subunit [Mesorhizobium sp. M1C.F.Ca.ET.212.01.1.1]TGQ98033.1 ABC transporter permease subunit [Mesorhizobium sp. M1C.F.Ca.ET.204.01.1.1]TGR18073.1 ABC 
MPLMILPMATVMSGIDQKLLRAVRANGASPLAAFLTVFLPLSLPGVIAGVLLVFIYCLGFYTLLLTLHVAAGQSGLGSPQAMRV